MATKGRGALIIEDELLIGMALQAMLSDMGFDSFAFASTPRQAVEQARLTRPDLVTVDIGLLDGDGFAAADAVLSAYGPIASIYVTANASVAAARPEAVVVDKPIAAAALARAVERAFAQVAERSSSPASGLHDGPQDHRHGIVTGPR